jgi:hypothetical protein
MRNKLECETSENDLRFAYGLKLWRKESVFPKLVQVGEERPTTNPIIRYEPLRVKDK